ncbi:MAG: hypothetical protein R3B53_02670 [Candidatus Paceibacterota bacterium]
MTDATNEQVTLCLDEAGESTPTNTKQTIRVGKRTIYGVYFVPEEILRKLLKSEHRNNINVYAQGSDGEILPFTDTSKILKTASLCGAIKSKSNAVKALRRKRG